LFRTRRLWWSGERLVFIDESGINLALTRPCGRAPRGERLYDSVPDGRWQNYTMIAGLRLDGLVAPMVLPGAMNAMALRAWVAQSLAPELRDGDIIVWDNLSVHDDAEVRRCIEATGARLEFLPPYSPDFNPIEAAWSKVKQALRAAAARKWRALVYAVGNAMQAVTPENCRAWFRHCGYRLT